MSHLVAAAHVFVSRHSIRPGAKDAMQEIGLLAAVEHHAKFMRMEFFGDFEDQGQRILTRAVRSGRGRRRRFRIEGHKGRFRIVRAEFEGLIESVKNQRAPGLKDPVMRFVATIRINGATAVISTC